MAVNDAILDGFVRHQIALARLANGEVRRFLRELTRAQRDIAVMVGALVGDHPGSVEQLIGSVRQMLRRNTDIARAAIASELSDLAIYESDASVHIINSALPADVHLDFTRPTAHQLTAILTTSLAGRPLNEWFESLAIADLNRIAMAVRHCIAEGLTTPQIVSAVRETFIGSRRNAEGVVRTMISAVTHEARDLLYQANEDLFSGVQWVSTLDNRTTEICQDRDGEVYPVDSGPRPPAHVNCRSTIVPVLRDAKALGLPASTRASMNGQVADDVTYGDWLARQSVAVQDEVLGATRGELFRAGNLSFDRFFNEQSHYYTLDELRTREASAFRRAGV